jgi:hypothetical protein
MKDHKDEPPALCIYEVRDIREGEEGFVLYGHTSRNAVNHWLDHSLGAIRDVQFLSLLNDIQTESGHGQDMNSPFYMKDTIPLYIVNMALQPYNLKIVETHLRHE